MKKFTLVACALMAAGVASAATLEGTIGDYMHLLEARTFDVNAGEYGDVVTNYAPNDFQYEFEAALTPEMSTSSDVYVHLYRGETELGSIPATATGWRQGVAYDPGFPSWGMPGTVTVSFYSVLTQESGEYRLVFDEGFFVSGADLLPGGEFTFEFTKSDEGGDVNEGEDFPYELTPASGESVETLSEITIVFPGKDIDYVDRQVATLKDAAGNLYNMSTKPNSAWDGIIFTINDELPAGVYTFTILPLTIAVDMTNFDAGLNGNFKGLTATITVTSGASVEVPELSDYIRMLLPADSECDSTNTENPVSEKGLQCLVFSLLSADITAAPADKYPDWISLNFMGAGESEYQYFANANPSDPEQVQIQNVQILADDDLDDAEPVAHLYIMFPVNPDYGVTEDMFYRTGSYQLVIPDGAFYLNGNPMNGVTFEYSYTDLNTGVAAVEGNVENVTVYSIDGRLVLNNAPAAAVSTLDNGLYVINGKKVLVRK